MQSYVDAATQSLETTVMENQKSLQRGGTK